MKNYKLFKSSILITCIYLLFGDPVQAQIDSNNIIRNIMTPTRVVPTTEQSIKENIVAKPYTLVSNEIRVFASSNPQSEIHVSVSKVLPQFLLLSSNTLVANSYQGAWWSLNGGTTWTGAETMPNNSSGRNDPSTAFDATGRGYLSTLTPVAGNLNANPVSYSIQTSTNNGSTWSAQVNGTPNTTIDKPMIGVDDMTSSPFANNLYCSWMGPNLFVQFNRSINQGVAFSVPINLTNYWGQGANVQTGPNGQVYVCWADYNGNNILNNWTSNGLGFCTSTNGGLNFTAAQRVINYTGIRQFNPGTNDDENANFNMIRVNDFPSMAVDKSGGTHRGRIYVAMPLRQNGNGKAITQVSFSDNQGVTWSTPLTVSIANALQSWFPWISVDASTGLVYVIYYAFDQASGFSTNTYIATSADGGVTFSNQKISSVAHTTAPIPAYTGGYEGDYIGVTSYNMKAYPAWMDNRSGQWQNYLVQLDNTPTISGIPAFCTSSTYTASNLLPNTTVTWSASPTGIVSLNPSGNSVTVTKVSQGNVTLNASINQLFNAIGSINITTIPQVSSISASMYGTCSNGVQSWLVSATPNLSASNWQWTVDNSNSGIYIVNPNSQTTYMNVSKGGGVSVTFRDACGETSIRNGVTIYSPCGHSFAVSPNPASSSVTIKVVSQVGNNNNNATTNSNIARVNIYDFQNNLKKQGVFNKVSIANFDISGLPSGIYIIEIEDGSNATKERQEFQIVK